MEMPDAERGLAPFWARWEDAETAWETLPPLCNTKLGTECPLDGTRVGEEVWPRCPVKERCREVYSVSLAEAGRRPRVNSQMLAGQSPLCVALGPGLEGAIGQGEAIASSHSMRVPRWPS